MLFGRVGLVAGHCGAWGSPRLLGTGTARNCLCGRWGRTRMDLGVRLAQWERRVPSGHGASEARGQQGGGSSPGDNGSSCPWGACPHAAGWECKEEPDPRNVTVLFLLQVSRGSRAQRGMDPASSRSPPGPTRSRSSPNECVPLELSSRESLRSWGGAVAPSPAHFSPLIAQPRWAAALLVASVERTTMALNQVPEDGDLGLVLCLRLPEAAWAARLPGGPLHTTAAFQCREQCRSFKAASRREQ